MFNSCKPLTLNETKYTKITKLDYVEMPKTYLLHFENEINLPLNNRFYRVNWIIYCPMKIKLNKFLSKYFGKC